MPADSAVRSCCYPGPRCDHSSIRLDSHDFDVITVSAEQVRGLRKERNREDVEALRLEEALPSRFVSAGELQQWIWYALFAKDYTKALAVADHARTLFPSNHLIEIKRAHALMFTGHDEEAKALYLAHKGEVPNRSGKLWEQIIAQDFTAFREAGLTRRMMADIEKELGISH